MGYVQLNKTLNAPLFILHLLHNLTSQNTLMDPTDQKSAMDTIHSLQKEIEDVNQGQYELIMDSILGTDYNGCMLQLAVEENNKIALEALLKRKANITGLCHGNTALHLAVLHKNKNFLETLLTEHPNVDVQNDECFIPIQLAAIKGFDEGIELLAGKESIWPLDKEHNNLVHLAAAAGHGSSITTIQKMYPLYFNHLHKVNRIEDHNNKMETALFIAAAKGHKEIIKQLKRSGANLMTKDQEGNTPLHKATETGNREILKFLLKQAIIPVDEINNKGNTPLHIALQTGRQKIAESLQDNRADRCKKGEQGNTVLHFAAQGNLAKYIRDTLKFKSCADNDVDVLNYKNYTPLHKAAAANRIDAIKSLIKKGAFIDAVNDLQKTPLYLAVINGAKEATDYLLCKNASISSVNKNSLSNTLPNKC